MKTIKRALLSIILVQAVCQPINAIGLETITATTREATKYITEPQNISNLFSIKNIAIASVVCTGAILSQVLLIGIMQIREHKHLRYNENLSWPYRQFVKIIQSID